MDGFYEFFAGGGMARLGLGPDWKCLFANDICEKKASAYRANFDGAPELIVPDYVACHIIRLMCPSLLCAL